MSDIYTPTIHEVRAGFRDGQSFVDVGDFDRWLAAHDAEVRAEVANEIAGTIWAEEQEANKAVWKEPTNRYANGALAGLQWARTSAEKVRAAARGEGAK